MLKLKRLFKGRLKSLFERLNILTITFFLLRCNLTDYKKGEVWTKFILVASQKEKKMKRIIFAIFSFLVLAHCESPSSAEKEALVEALNGHRRDAAPYNQLAHWDEHYSNFSHDAVQSCEKVRKFPGLSEHVSTANSNYLVDAVDFWVQDGKEDEKLGCPRFACNDYHVLISSHLSRIGCGYKDCPSLGGVYVVCQYDFILD